MNEPEDGCDHYWKDHCVPLNERLWEFATGEIVLKDDPKMDVNDWRQCAIRRHEHQVGP
jgi:hypothetical protein